MPSKALLRPPEVLAAARRAPGAAEAITGGLDVQRVFWHRDQVTGRGDDSSQAEWLEQKRVSLIRGEARVLRPGVIAVGDREVPYRAPDDRDRIAAVDSSDRRARRRRLLDEP